MKIPASIFVAALIGFAAGGAQHQALRENLVFAIAACVFGWMMVVGGRLRVVFAAGITTGFAFVAFLKGPVSVALAVLLVCALILDVSRTRNDVSSSGGDIGTGSHDPV
ncbi:MAG: hypothetical protein EOP84_31300 [Verrucomicrobiaceae bacterium]|nr:MAG: hypothetical protein EOP84_31300 [Verrucomicrobiaceae bacterium]